MPTPFELALAEIDRLHAGDPASIDRAGRAVPRELAYAERMTTWLARLEPAASEALALAVRAQHLCRWELPRTAYPEGRVGYLKWRTELSARHASRAARALRDAGYADDVVARVERLVRKKGIKTDPEAQLLEDAACLTFLEMDYAEFATKHEDAKVIDILKKTWAKMSPRARSLAPTIVLPERAARLVAVATAAPP